MKIHVCTPYSVDKNLGRAYNEACSLIPDGDWICLIDHDLLFLSPNSIGIMYDYVEQYPDAGLFTCLANRIHPLAVDQLYLDKPSDNDSVRFWQHHAAVQESTVVPEAIEIKHEISGFLMLFSKHTWNKIQFNETGKCLGVDNDFSLRVMMSGKKLYRMNRILVWHSYRLNDIKDKSHLR